MYSRQRELIYNAVVDNPIHPTAEMVYDIVRKENPRISLGTVYRNLQRFAERGELARLSFPDKPDRYDGCTRKHYHGMCTECGNISDIFLSYLEDIDKTVSLQAGIKVISHNILFSIICPDCQTKGQHIKEK